jgi:hypothetical protein
MAVDLPRRHRLRAAKQLSIEPAAGVNHKLSRLTFAARIIRHKMNSAATGTRMEQIRSIEEESGRQA